MKKPIAFNLIATMILLTLALMDINNLKNENTRLRAQVKHCGNAPAQCGHSIICG